MKGSSVAHGLSRRGLLQIAAAAAGYAVAGLAGLLPRRARAAPPVWATVPDQTWTVGVPVHLDLAAYATDPDGDIMTFALDQPLPPGLTLAGSVISGTPLAELASTPFVASASDLADTEAPAAPTGLQVL